MMSPCYSTLSSGYWWVLRALHWPLAAFSLDVKPQPAIQTAVTLQE